MSSVNLASNVRQNLLSLQDTAALQSLTTQHLSTGKKVSSALDNPVNFFTAAGLTNRSSQLSGLLDGISNGIQTIQAANKGLTSITSLIQQLQSTAKQARQDTTGTVTPGTAIATTGANTSTATNSKITFAVGSQNIDIATYTTGTAGTPATPTTLNAASAYTANGGPNSGAGSFKIQIGSGTAQSVSFSATDTASDIAASINTATGKTTATVGTGGELDLSDADGASITLTDGTGSDVGSLTALKFSTTSSTNGVAAVPGTGSVKSVDDIVSAINSNGLLVGKVKAEKDTGGHLKLSNTTTDDITVKGFSGTALSGDAAVSTTLTKGTAALSTTRQSLANQFNTLVSQLDKLSADSSFNGVNLLQGEHLKVSFNEKTGAANNSLDVSLKKADNTDFGPINAFNLSIGQAATTATGAGIDFRSNDALDGLSDTLTNALNTVQTQSSALGANLSVVQTRQDFTKQIIDVLTTGSGNLTDADMNEEAANSTALSTRQSLGISALSLANQANQGILQLLR